MEYTLNEQSVGAYLKDVSEKLAKHNLMGNLCGAEGKEYLIIKKK